ncbi:MAG: hypothetical protein JOZ05_08505 [Acetobacteraceae bacterium]|nr:hypothetical protein [Acetobacteraceae bacterium]
MQAAVKRLSSGRHWPDPRFPNEHPVAQELPVGSELLIALTLGGAGWWAIIKLVEWVVIHLT